MRDSLNKGFSFGLTSGVITTLGLMVGLYSGTHSRLVVAGAVITIAIADSLSDALSIHISEESENRHTAREVWEATLCTLGTKLAVTLTFLAPVLLLPLHSAIIVSIPYGLFLVAAFSYHMARQQKNRAVPVVAEHLSITVAVIIATYYIGKWVSTAFV